MAEWNKSFNKDYHFITVESSTEKYYGYQYSFNCSGELDLYMLLKSYSQQKSVYISGNSLTANVTYWSAASVALELSGLVANVVIYDNNAIKTRTHGTGWRIDIKLNESQANVVKTLTKALKARTGAVKINGATMQSTA